MSSSNPIYALREENSLGVQRASKSAKQRNELFVEKAWKEKGVSTEIIHNIDGGVAVYNRLDRNPGVGLFNKRISAGNG